MVRLASKHSPSGADNPHLRRKIATNRRNPSATEVPANQPYPSYKQEIVGIQVRRGDAGQRDGIGGVERDDSVRSNLRRMGWIAATASAAITEPMTRRVSHGPS